MERKTRSCVAVVALALALSLPLGLAGCGGSKSASPSSPSSKTETTSSSSSSSSEKSSDSSSAADTLKETGKEVLDALTDNETYESILDDYSKQIADCMEMRQAVLREAFEGRL